MLRKTLDPSSMNNSQRLDLDSEGERPYLYVVNDTLIASVSLCRYPRSRECVRDNVKEDPPARVGNGKRGDGNCIVALSASLVCTCAGASCPYSDVGP